MIQKHSYVVRTDGGKTTYRVTDLILFGIILLYRNRSQR